MLSRFSRVPLTATLWTIACQAPLSMGFSRQECWSGSPCPPPRDLSNPKIEPVPLTSPALAGKFFSTRISRKPSGNLNDYVLLSDSSDSKESACNAGDLGSIPGAGRFPGEGDATHFSILVGEFHRQTSLAIYSPLGCKKLDTTKQLTLHSTHLTIGSVTCA